MSDVLEIQYSVEENWECICQRCDCIIPAENEYCSQCQIEVDQEELEIQS